MNDRDILVVAPRRTAIGTFGGALKDVPAVDLGASVAKAVLADAGVSGDQVDDVIVGNVIAAGIGMNPGRQVAIKAGLPVSVPAMTLNRACGSGVQSIIVGAQQVALGEASVVLAGGIENMDLAPFLLPKARYGYRMGTPGAELLDSMVSDGLTDVFNNYHMGITAENVAEKYGVSRQESDEYALRSHQRAAAAIRDGLFDAQIVPVELKTKRDVVQFNTDEHVRADATLEAMARLRPAFKPDGTVTAANASGINNGAAMALVMSAARAAELNPPVAGRLVAYAVAGVDPAYMGTGPIPATRKALAKAGLTVDDIDIFEINEAFAVIALIAGRELEIPDEKLNPLGGAVALGHPVGATGTILVTKLLYELERRRGRFGVVALCIGGGMGIAAVLERVAAQNGAMR